MLPLHLWHQPLSSNILLLALLAKMLYWENHESRLSNFGGQLAPNPMDIPDPSHGKVFREKFRSVYVVKGAWSLLTDLLLNRLNANFAGHLKIATRPIG